LIEKSPAVLAPLTATVTGCSLSGVARRFQRGQHVDAKPSRAGFASLYSATIFMTMRLPGVIGA
jgi:hypothetical protein